jgi:hypothetical protein
LFSAPPLLAQLDKVTQEQVSEFPVSSAELEDEEALAFGHLERGPSWGAAAASVLDQGKEHGGVGVGDVVVRGGIRGDGAFSPHFSATVAVVSALEFPNE